jgi:hypothetical protein
MGGNVQNEAMAIVGLSLLHQDSCNKGINYPRSIDNCLYTVNNVRTRQVVLCNGKRGDMEEAKEDERKIY